MRNIKNCHRLDKEDTRQLFSLHDQYELRILGIRFSMQGLLVEYQRFGNIYTCYL